MKRIILTIAVLGVGTFAAPAAMANKPPAVRTFVPTYCPEPLVPISAGPYTYWVCPPQP